MDDNQTIRYDAAVSGRPTPKVSIGFPVYNGEAHVVASLESLLAQTFQDFEIIISDNASTDATESLCREYAARDPRVRFVRNDRNQGVAWNFNHVFKLSKGTYFKWASSNDIHDAKYVQKCIEVLESDPTVVVAYPKTRIIDEHGVVIRDYEDNLNLMSPDPVRRFRDYLTRVRRCNALFGLMRRNVLARTGRLGNFQSSDMVLLGELTLYGKFAEVPEFLFYRRHEPVNVMRDASLETWREFFDPAMRGKVSMRTWRLQFEYFMAAMHAPLSIPDKARVLGTNARVVIAVRRQLLRELVGAVHHVATRRSE